MPSEKPIRRILLKLSGEALMGERAHGHDPAAIARIAGQIKGAHDLGFDVSVVVGAGNILRGAAMREIDRVTADYMGMLATIINALALAGHLERLGVVARVQSALPVAAGCEPYNRDRALDHLERRRVVVFAAGTGNPFFTTDTAATLRACEMRCDILLKGTQVDGVYSADPKTDPGATRYERLSFEDVLAQNLKVMDSTAIALARENHLPIIVFSIHAPNALAEVLAGHGRFTTIS
jgi:uridylate kinase